MALNQKWVNRVMTPEDKRFYRELGQRIAQFRRAQELTQVQLAEILGIAQQTMAHYEGGSLRIAVALLRPLAKALHVSFEELINEPPSATKKKRGPSSKLQQQMERVSMLPRTKQKVVMEMLDGVLSQAGR